MFSMGFCYKVANFDKFISRERLSDKVNQNIYTIYVYMATRPLKKNN